uniref:Uncharacterized protein n=1 Tax=viral metagenome TaxID=1070528 RepID=A0A6C0F5Y7_9ZZZZ
MDVLFGLVLLWAFYTLYKYVMTANYSAIIVSIVIYFLLSLLIKNKTTVLLLTITFTNCFLLCKLLNRIFSIIKVLTKKPM